MDWSARETIVGIATAPGQGAVAIVRLSGKESLASALKLFRSQRNLQPDTIQSHQLYLGHIHHPQSEVLLDQGLLVFMRSPNSYTGEDCVELQLHGGPSVPYSVQQALLSLPNLRLAQPGEFTFRAFLNQRLNFMQAEAVQDLITANSGLAQQIALKQLEGRGFAAFAPIRQELAKLLSEIEADIDFPDEALSISEQSEQLHWAKGIRDKFAHWLQTAEWQREAQRALSVAIVGAPNAGKSTLFNSFLGQERAIVSSMPGTTRDYLDATVEIHGSLVQLIDTAGIRAIDDSVAEEQGIVEAIGIAKAKEWLEHAQLVFFLLDAKNLLEQSEPLLATIAVEKSDIQWVINKIDLLTTAERGLLTEQYPQAVQICAKSGEGLDPLREIIKSRCLDRLAKVQSIQICVNERQRLNLEQAHRHLDRAIALMEQSKGNELVAQELWLTSTAVDELTGESLSESVIEEIFNNFCIGK